MKKLWRRKNKTDVAKITSFCVQQLESSGQSHGSTVGGWTRNTDDYHDIGLYYY